MSDETPEFFKQRWGEQLKGYVQAYKAMQKPKWKLGDIAAEVDKGSRKAFWHHLYESRNVDVSHAEFDHYLQTAIAFPPDKRVLTKSWSLHFKLRNVPDRWDLIRKDEIRRVADADEELKRRNLVAEQREEERQEDDENQQQKEASFQELWDELRYKGEGVLKKWLADHVNWELELDDIMRIRKDSRVLIDAWLEAIDSEFNDTLELQRTFCDVLQRERVPF